MLPSDSLGFQFGVSVFLAKEKADELKKKKKKACHNPVSRMKGPQRFLSFFPW